MKEIFTIKRFLALTKLHYRENMFYYLLMLAIMAVLALLFLTQGNPIMIQYNSFSSCQQGNVIGQIYNSMEYNNLQKKVFWIFWAVFSVWLSSRALCDFNRKEKSQNLFLLPASTTEKFLLAFLNTTVVLGVMWIVVFYSVDWLVAHYKYGFFLDDTGMYIRKYAFDMFSFTDPVRERILRPALVNVFDFSTVPNRKEFSGFVMPSYGWLMIGIFYLQSLFMLGSLFFKRQAVLITFLIQILIFACIGYLVYIILDNFQQSLEPVLGSTKVDTDQIKMFVMNREDNERLLQKLLYGLYLFYLFPVCYFWAAFSKLKNKQM